MSNPYEPPKANPTINEKLAQVTWGVPLEFRSAMWISWSVLVILSLGSATQMRGEGPAILAVAFLNGIVQPTLAVFAVFYMRGTEIQARKAPYLISRMSWFGLLWRAYLSMILAVLPIAAIAYLVLGHADRYSVPRLIAGGFIEGISILIVVWTLFSNDRMGQLRWAFSRIRGW